MPITFNESYYTSLTYVGKTTNGGVSRSGLAGSGYVYPFSTTSQINDAAYFLVGGGYFTGINFKSSPSLLWMTSTSHTIVWEYYDGSVWQLLPNLVDGTNGFRNYGIVTWTLPNDWNLFNYISVNNYRGWWIRARLTEFVNITSNVQLYLGGEGYITVRPYCIEVSGTESVTPASLKAASDANGWNAVLFDNNRKYTFPHGLYLNGSYTTTFTINGEHLQFGTPEKAAFHYRFIYSKWVINSHSTYKVSTLSSHIEFYTSFMAYDVVTIGAAGDQSEINNVMFSIHCSDPNKQFNCVYRMRFFGGTTTQIYNVIFDGTMYNNESGNYERVSFPMVQYLLSRPNASYKNVFFNQSFSVDGNFLPTIENGVFDGSPSTSQWYGHYLATGSDTVPGFMEVIDCEWPNGNKEVPCNYLAGATPTGNFHARCLYSHRFNLKVIDNEGNVISNAIVKLKDAYGNDALLTPTNAYINTTIDTSTTTIITNNSAAFDLDNYYHIIKLLENLTHQQLQLIDNS